MKSVKNFLFAVLLVSTLAFNTFAGDIETPGYAPPTPPRAMCTCDENTPVTDSNTEGAGEITAETSDYLFFEALAALLSVY